MTRFAEVMDFARGEARRLNSWSNEAAFPLTAPGLAEEIGWNPNTLEYAGIRRSAAPYGAETSAQGISWAQNEMNRVIAEQQQRTMQDLWVNPTPQANPYEAGWDNPIAPASQYFYQYASFPQISYVQETPKKEKVKLVEEPSRSMLKRAEMPVEDLDLTDPRKKLATEAEALLGYTPLRKELRTPGTLRRVLAKLEIAVLEQASVDKYKAQMVEHYRTAGKMLDPTWRLTSLRYYGQPVPEFVLQKAVEIKRELPEAEFYIDQLAVDPFLIVSMEGIPDFMLNTSSRELDPEMAAYVEVWSEPKFEATV